MCDDTEDLLQYSESLDRPDPIKLGSYSSHTDLSSITSHYSSGSARFNRIQLEVYESPVLWQQSYQCYLACKDKREEEASRQVLDKVKAACCKERSRESRAKCCSSRSVSPSLASDALPLSKVLCNLKEAASFDRKCNAKLNDLMETEKQLNEQILHLEHREKEGVALLQQADCMWACMEEAYKKKISESVASQNVIHGKLSEVEKSASKWRKKKKELEIEINAINKRNKEVKERIHQKSTELNIADDEIESLKKKIETIKKETERVTKSLGSRKTGTNKKIQNITNQINELKKELEEEKKNKSNKENEGLSLIKDVRDDFTNINKVLLQKQLLEQDLQFEKQGLNEEIDLLKQALDNSESSCELKKQNLIDETALVTKEITEFKVKCIQCHECSDTTDIRSCCTDCPRCADQRDCLYDNDKCYLNDFEDCICTRVKNRLLDNIFENMNSVLEKQTDTCSGKALSEAVLKCLKTSRNGKLDPATRKIVRDFILSTIKRNLGLTVVGGAIKTRCELDPDSYKQLMLCLNKVDPPGVTMADKAIDVKKDPCTRWGGESECNCPKGPTECVCNSKNGQPRGSTASARETNKDNTGEICPKNNSFSCKMGCVTRSSIPRRKSTDIWKPTPCKGHTCNVTKTAAQCVYGPELLKGSAKSLFMSEDSNATVLLSSTDDVTDNCICKRSFDPTCPLHADLLNRPREKIIDEVFGKFTDISPVGKVLSYDCIDLNNTE